MKKEFLSWLALSVAVILSAAGTSCSQVTAFQKAMSLYCESKLAEALPELQAAATQDEKNADVYAWLAETLRRLGRKQDALTAARKSLSLDPCNSFAHLVIADASNPMYGNWEGANEDTSWTHLMDAIRCDSSDGNAWITAWVEAIKHNNMPMMQEACHRLISTGFLTGPALSWGTWLLRGLPQDAILITNGDMDTFPPSAIQVAEGFRPDVAIVNRSLLNTPWYARYVRDYEKVSIPFSDAALDTLSATRDSAGKVHTPSDAIFQSWLKEKEDGQLQRPLAIAVTVDWDLYAADSNQIEFAGPFLLWTQNPVRGTIDTTLVLASFKDVRPGDFAGDWVSPQDRSPVRRTATRTVVGNVIYASWRLAKTMTDAHDFAEAQHWVDWGEELVKISGLGPVYSKDLDSLRDELKQANH